MPARAKLPPGEGKRVPLNMRTTREVRERLERDAADSGRSLAQEIEYHLERSLTDSDERYRGFGSKGRASLLRLLGLVLETVEVTTGKDAFADPEAANDAHEMMACIIDRVFAARPGGPVDTVSPTAGQEAIIKDPGARTSMQNLCDVWMESRLADWPGAHAFYSKASSGRGRRKR